MNRLSDVDLLPSYHKGQHDIASDFYMPCLEMAVKYDRAVGYFSSTIYVLAWKSLKQFVRAGGKMRIVCSPALNTKDIDAVSQGYEARMNDQIEKLRADIREMLDDPYLTKPARVLSALVALGVIEVKIAFMNDKTPPRHKRIFHDKVGIFTDKFENKVVFKGSMNETWLALSNDGNLESVDVFVSWSGGRDQIRVEDESSYFETLWKNEYDSVDVRPFPDVLRDELLAAGDPSNWPDLVDEINEEIAISQAVSADKKVGGRRPRPHQLHAIQAWFRHGRGGIFEHATGSGKTFTALCIIRDAIVRGEVPLILVPSDLLLQQWNTEVKETLQDLSPNILLCGGGHTRWRSESLLRPWTRKGSRPRTIIATMQTASSQDFLSALVQGEHILIVADEAHRLGSLKNRNIFSVQSGPRLGLSATPRRSGDLDGTNAILTYFDGIIPPPFTLKDAIKSKALTPYMYYVHGVSLTPEEQSEWNAISTKIRQIYARNMASGAGTESVQQRINQLLINRARIVKTARNKIYACLKVVRENYAPGQKWIVYCDNQKQLSKVLDLLRTNHFDAIEYHSSMEGDRDETLRYFKLNGGILVSIRCLDEGVDIPSVSHALILASSKNPREFIQRRGRVLRRSDEKHLSFIHDVLVQPESNSQDNPINTKILEAEIARAIEFGEGAINPSSIYELKRIMLHAGLEYKELATEGFEDDEE